MDVHSGASESPSESLPFSFVRDTSAHSSHIVPGYDFPAAFHKVENESSGFPVSFLADREQTGFSPSQFKSHHYILSFDPRDRTENELAGEYAQQLGLEYARKNFPGHQALVCTHTDGSNESGNIHVHIVINSVRKYDVKRQDFMERPCDSRAGYKHHLTRDYLNYLKQEVMDICHREQLHQINLFAPAEKKITDREYQARRRGQKKMEERNQKMRAECITPCKTTFETQKNFLRSAIDEATAVCASVEEFQKFLWENHGISFKVCRGRYSYLHPERNKAITGRNLGTRYEKEHLLPILEKNAKARKDVPTGLHTFLFMQSDLRLVTDLQSCVKAQQNEAYARKVKLSNLQQLAKTVAYVQEHGYQSEQDLADAFQKAQTQASQMRKALRKTEQDLKGVNEQIHYTGQYLTNKSVYKQYLSSKNKKKFRQEHQSEVMLYETARKVLKVHANSSKLPSMKTLKQEKENLLAQKNSQYEAYQNLRSHAKELKTVQANVAAILGKNLSWQTEQDRESIRS